MFLRARARRLAHVLTGRPLPRGQFSSLTPQELAAYHKAQQEEEQRLLAEQAAARQAQQEALKEVQTRTTTSYASNSAQSSTKSRPYAYTQGDQPKTRKQNVWNQAVQYQAGNYDMALIPFFKMFYESEQGKVLMDQYTFTGVAFRITLFTNRETNARHSEDYFWMEYQTVEDFMYYDVAQLQQTAGIFEGRRVKDKSATLILKGVQLDNAPPNGAHHVRFRFQYFDNQGNKTKEHKLDLPVTKLLSMQNLFRLTYPQMVGWSQTASLNCFSNS